jgi:hypothetical protein
MKMPHAVDASNQINQGDISIHGNGNVTINQTVATGLPLAAPGPAASAAPIALDDEEADADGKRSG